jgi:hypothetical protein
LRWIKLGAFSAAECRMFFPIQNSGFRGRGRTIVIHQNPVSGSFHVFKLPALHRPQKDAHNQKDQDNAQGNQQVKYFHGHFLTVIAAPGPD